jgi:hypothetical protein
MTASVPFNKSQDYTHMYDFTDLRGSLPLKHANKDSLLWHINNTETLSDFSQLINTAKIGELLDNLNNDYTIFAFKNKTFIFDETLHKGEALQIVKTNMVNRRIPLQLLSNSYSAEYPTLHNVSKIYTEVKEGQLTLNNKVKILDEIICKNGILYITDGLLMPDVYM